MSGNGAAYLRHGAGRPRSADEIIARRPKVIAVWRSAQPTPGTPAELYFKRRGIPWLVACQWLRFYPDCPHPAKDANGNWLGLRFPAVIALLLDADDNVAGLQKIFITGVGDKAAIEPRRISVGCVAGNAIHLHQAAQQIVVAEGLETAASAAILLDRPAWAAAGAGNLKSAMRLPKLPLASDVVIACDADEPGRKAANAAWHRWTAERRRVRIATPEKPCSDFNDILRERAR